MKFAPLALLALLGSASAGGLQPAAFMSSQFCQKYGCTQTASWTRFDRKYEVYQITQDKNVELALYQDAAGNVVGATYSTWTTDDWSGHYARAAAFLNTVYPGANFNTRLMAQLDRNTTRPAFNLKWNGQTLVLYRETARVPSYTQLVRMNVSAGVFRPGQP